MRCLTLALATALTLLATTLVPATAHAWGKTGHRVTGAIAEQHLTAEARAGVQAILGNESLARASTWADEMRSNPTTFWQRTANPWHYVTVPPGATWDTAAAPPQGDAGTALAKFAAMVRDPATSLEQKQLALRFIVHLVGDLHQPLHAGNGLDRGGNDVRVQFMGEPMNLHSLWDSGLVDYEQLSYSEWADWLSRRTTPEQVVAWLEPDPTVWIAESAALRDGLYPPAAERDNLRWDYVYQHMPTVRERLAKGGVRIAAYLNALFANN